MYHATRCARDAVIRSVFGVGLMEDQSNFILRASGEWEVSATAIPECEKLRGTLTGCGMKGTAGSGCWA